ncbi:hypothetical protein ACZ90_45865 [Streptomyces albus subsp. albus]|nr:hypothetical protein ACZ90_45865 [Streptomyces albus subsp. albus]
MDATRLGGPTTPDAHGDGEATVEIAESWWYRAAILEIEAESWLTVTSVDRRGKTERRLVSGDVGQPFRGRVLINHDLDEHRPPVRRLAVGCRGRWTLRLHEVTQARPFTDSAEGEGPEVLAYRGGAGRAAVTHRGRRGQFVLHAYPRGPEGGARTLARDGEDYDLRTQGVRTWEYEAELAGPQLLAVAEGERWQIALRATEPTDERIRDARPFRHQGTGEETVAFPDGVIREPAILELDRSAGSPAGSPLVELLDAGGERLDLFADSPPRGPARWLIDRRTSRPHGTPAAARITYAEGDWVLSVVPAATARPFEKTASGTGPDVITHTGPPGALRLRRTGSSTRAQVSGHDDTGSLTLVSGKRGGSGEGAVVGPYSPRLLQVNCKGGWELSVLPDGELREFDHAIDGEVGEVVRYTGPAGRARLRALTWRRYDPVHVETFTRDFVPKTFEAVYGGPVARFRSETLYVTPGMLLAVRPAERERAVRWRIRVR